VALYTPGVSTSVNGARVVRAEDRAPYGSTVWIALAWMCLAATVAIAVLTWLAIRQPCAEWCFTTVEATLLSVLLTLPFLLAALVTAFALTPVTRNWSPSANLAGFVTALIAVPLSTSLIYVVATIFF
jgi:hypothetical protein